MGFLGQPLHLQLGIFSSVVKAAQKFAGQSLESERSSLHKRNFTLPNLLGRTKHLSWLRQALRETS